MPLATKLWLELLLLLTTDAEAEEEMVQPQCRSINPPHYHKWKCEIMQRGKVVVCHSNLQFLLLLLLLMLFSCFSFTLLSFLLLMLLLWFSSFSFHFVAFCVCWCCCWLVAWVFHFLHCKSWNGKWHNGHPTIQTASRPSRPCSQLFCCTHTKMENVLKPSFPTFSRFPILHTELFFFFFFLVGWQGDSEGWQGRNAVWVFFKVVVGFAATAIRSVGLLVFRSSVVYGAKYHTYIYMALYICICMYIYCTNTLWRQKCTSINFS